MDIDIILECVDCGHVVYTHFGHEWKKVYECDYCGRVYDTANYTVDKWANMFRYDPLVIADDWGVEYTPDSETDSAPMSLIEQAKELHYALVNRYWELRDTKGKTKQARRVQKLAQKAMLRWLRRIKANNA